MSDTAFQKSSGCFKILMFEVLKCVTEWLTTFLEVKLCEWVQESLGGS